MRVRNLLWPLLFALSACGGGDGDSEQLPVAAFDYSCSESVCSFDASASTAAAGKDLAYQWQFGDSAGGRAVSVLRAYSTGGQHEVTLTVTDTSGKKASTTQTLTVNGNAAAEYFHGVHDTFAVLLFVNEFLVAVQAFGDDVQDEVEARGNPLDESYSFDCPAGGEVGVVRWTDTNNNLVIDENEYVAINADACRLEVDGPAFTTVNVVNLGGDFDSDSFRYTNPSGVNGRLNIDSYPDWGMQGTANFTTVRSNGSIDTISFESSNLFTLHIGTAGVVDLRMATPIDMTRDFSTLDDITGEATLDFLLLGTEYSAEITEPMDLAETAGGLRMKAGKIGFLVGDDRVYLSPDADPAYLSVEVDKDDNGSVDVTARFPQTPTLERLLSAS